LDECTTRLASVQIDHRDFEAVIRSYDSPETCFYLDPPYLWQTRQKSRCYQHEMREEDHARLLSTVLSVKGMVILSGYTHHLYQEALSGWDCIECTAASTSAAGVNGADAPARRECVWRNTACLAAPPVRQLPLFVQEGGPASGSS